MKPTTKNYTSIIFFIWKSFVQTFIYVCPYPAHGQYIKLITIIDTPNNYYMEFRIFWDCLIMLIAKAHNFVKFSIVNSAICW